LLSMQEALCLGASRNKLCTKACINAKSCGVPTHENHKAKVEAGWLYVKENDTKAFVEPILDPSFLSDGQLALLMSKSHMKEQWHKLFDDLQQGDFPEWLLSPSLIETQAVQPLATGSTNLLIDIKSPTAANKKTDIFDIYPALSYEDDFSHQQHC